MACQLPDTGRGTESSMCTCLIRKQYIPFDGKVQALAVLSRNGLDRIAHPDLQRPSRRRLVTMLCVVRVRNNSVM